MFWADLKRVHEESTRELKLNPVGKSCQNAMEVEENSRGYKYGDAHTTDSEYGRRKMYAEPTLDAGRTM